MQAILLAGGLGTRLREETEFKPKPMVEVGGKPILWHILKTYAHYGVRDFIVCTGYKSEVIKDYFLDYEARNNDFTIELGSSKTITFHDRHDEHDWKVTVSDTGQDTMTGGRVKRVRPFVKDETFMVTYGDGVADINIDELVAFHKSHGKIATLTTVQAPSRFGILDIDDGSKVQSFVEKPQEGGWINGGYFVFEPGVFDYIKGDDTVLEQEPLERLAKDGELMAYRHEGFWQAMDTFREAKILNDAWEQGAPWKVWK